MPALIRQARRLLDKGEAAVLITVAQTKGSAPVMLVPVCWSAMTNYGKPLVVAT